VLRETRESTSLLPYKRNFAIVRCARPLDLPRARIDLCNF